MASLAVLNPIPQFFELDGDPLDNGRLYFGVVNQNPQINPIQVTWDAAGLIPAAQPIRTQNGYPARAGTPSAVFAATDYSLLVRDKKGRVVFYAPNSADFGNAAALQALILQYISDLANTSDPTQGDNRIGVKRTTIAAVASTLHNWINGTVISAAEVGVTPAASSAFNTATLNALIVASPGRRIYFPNGTYQFGDLLLAGNTHYWFGDGIEGTKFQYTGSGTFINAEKAADAFLPRSPVYLSGIQFDGVTKGTKVGLSIKNRHDYEIHNCDFRNFSTLIKLEMAYIGVFDNVNGTACDIGWDLVGDINRVAFRSCGVTDFNTYGVRIRPGTFGCLGLEFSNCDFEFAAGVCIRMESDDLVTFRDCYIGDGCIASTFEITSGKVTVDGGLVQWGQSAGLSNRIVEFVGVNPTSDERSLTITRCKVNGGTYGSPTNERMVKGDGKLYLYETGIATLPTWNGVASLITGNPLGRMPGFNALNSPHGRTFTGGKTGAVLFVSTPTLSNGSLFLQCTGAGGAGDFIYALSPALVASKLQTFGAGSVIVVYKSNSAWGIQFAGGGAFNTAPTAAFGTAVIPNSANTLCTLVIQNQVALNGVYGQVEIFRQNPAINDFIEIYEVYAFDERQAGSIGSLYAARNLYKPI